MAPTTPYVILRPYKRDADIILITGLINATRRADGNDHLLTEEKVANTFRHTPGFDPYQDVVIIEMNGQSIGCSRVWWATNRSGQRIHFSVGAILPEWRGRGIGGQVLHHNQARLRQIAAAVPGDAPRFFDTWAVDTEEHCHRMLRRDGYQPLTYQAQMLRPVLSAIPDAPLPPGIELRPVRPEHMRAIWEADEEAFSEDIGHLPGGEDSFRKFLDDPLADPALWRVAWDGDQVAGQVRSFINAEENDYLGRRRGYTEYISTRRPWRGRGIARALIARSLEALRARGMAEAALTVATENPHHAQTLYESVGFQVTRRLTIYRKPMDLRQS